MEIKKLENMLRETMQSGMAIHHSLAMLNLGIRSCERQNIYGEGWPMRSIAVMFSDEVNV